jgi:peptide/nickel transport system substrate-binding protein
MPPGAYSPDSIDSDNTVGGIGPYKISKWIRDQELVLVANENYYGAKPSIKTVVIKFYSDASTLRLATESGEVDIAWRSLNPTDISSLKSNTNLNIWESPGPYIRYVVLNTNIAPFDNKLVRQALASALDRTSLKNTVFSGTVDELYSLVPIGMWSHQDLYKDKYGNANIEKAKQLLTQAGYSTSNKLDIEFWYTPTHYGSTEADVASLIKASWESTGMISVTIKSAEWSTYLQYSRSKSLGASLFGWYPDYLDPDDYTYPFLHSGSNRWLGEPYSNPEMDTLLEQAQVELDQSKRAILYEQIQEICAEDAPFIPMYQGRLFAVSKVGVKGLVLDQLMMLRYYLISW